MKSYSIKIYYILLLLFILELLDLSINFALLVLTYIIQLFSANTKVSGSILASYEAPFTIETPL